MQKAISITSLWDVMYSFGTLQMETHGPPIFWYIHIKEYVTFDLDTRFLRTYNLAKIKNSIYKAARVGKRATSYVTNNCVSQRTG